MARQLTRIITSLYLGNMSDPTLLEYAHRRIANVTANPAFITVFPRPITVTAAIDTFAAALQAQRPGDKASTKAKNVARAVLEPMVDDFASGCAMIAGTDVALFLTTGFNVKRAAMPTTSIDTPSAFEVTPGASGQLLIKRFAVPRGRSYEMFIGTTPATMQYHSTQSGRRLFISDLIPGTLYYISMRAVGPHGLISAMSQLATQRTM